MHVEIRFDFTPLFLEKHRQKESRTEPPTECCQDARAPARLESGRGMAVPRQKICPHDDVSVLDVGESSGNVFLLWGRFGVRKDAVQICCVGFVLPMVLERMDVDVIGVRSSGGGLEG